MIKRMTLYWKKYLSSNYDISYAGLRDWLAGLELKASSKKSISISIAKFMYTYEMIDYTEYIRIRGLFKSKVESWSDKAMSDEEIVLVFNTIMSFKIDRFYIIRDMTLFMLLFITGMRIGQLLEIGCDDIIFDEDYTIVKIPTSKKDDTKSLYQSTYTLTIPNDAGFKQINLRKLLEIYLHLRSSRVPKHSIRFLCTLGGKEINAENVRSLCRNIDSTKRITPHRFRHTAISYAAVNAGITKAAILANHSSIETTKRYVQSTMGDISDVFRTTTVDND